MVLHITKLLSLLLPLGASVASAEDHTVTFENRCGHGTPKLIKGPKVLHSGGGKYTHKGALISAIAYLQTGNCGFNGEHCTMIETTLKNPSPGTPGSGSSTDITLIPSHKFSVATGFKYFNGCDGKGHECKSAGCKTAFHKDSDTHVQVACQVKNVDLHITFC